jgi:hypothetical protein
MTNTAARVRQITAQELTPLLDNDTPVELRDLRTEAERGTLVGGIEAWSTVVDAAAARD